MSEKIWEDIYEQLKARWWGIPLVVLGLLFVVLFSIWNSLPDTTKERLLTSEQTVQHEETTPNNMPSSISLTLQEDKPKLLFNDQLMITLVSINRTAIPPHIQIEISGNHIKNTHQIKLGSRTRFTFNNKNYFINVFEVNNSSAKISVTEIM